MNTMYSLYVVSKRTLLEEMEICYYPSWMISLHYKKCSIGRLEVYVMCPMYSIMFIGARDGAITLLMSNFNKLLITVTNFYWNDNEECMLFGNENETEIELPERSQ